jgi:hypothetical protein
MRRVIAIALSSALVLQAAPLLAASAAGAAAGQEQAVTGVLNGTAQTSTGQTLSNYAVQARNLQTGQIAGTSTSNAAGGFSFGGLNPGNYVVELVNSSGTVVGSSASIAVAAGVVPAAAAATVTVTLAATEAIAGVAGAAAAGTAAAGAGAAAGISTALVVTAVAVAAGVAGVVVVAANDASPSR